jgi:hypothetical protein
MLEIVRAFHSTDYIGSNDHKRRYAASDDGNNHRTLDERTRYRSGIHDDDAENNTAR